MRYLFLLLVSTSSALANDAPFYIPSDNKPGFWNEECQTHAYVNEDCTVLSINPANGETTMPSPPRHSDPIPLPVYLRRT